MKTTKEGRDYVLAGEPSNEREAVLKTTLQHFNDDIEELEGKLKIAEAALENKQELETKE